MACLETPAGLIDVTEHGHGDDVIVLVHATATGPKSIAALAHALAGPRSNSARRILTPALAGYGGTKPAAALADDPIRANVGIVQEVLRRSCSKRRLVFGHSMGGMVALLAAIDAARAGAPFDALALYEPILLELIDQADPAQAAAHAWNHGVADALAREVAAGNREAGVRHFIEAWNETRWPALPERGRRHLIARADAFVAETGALGGHWITTDVLAELAMPTLFIRGALSPDLSRYIAENAMALIPEAREMVLDGCGHMAPLLAPARVAGCLDAFMQEVWQG